MFLPRRVSFDRASLPLKYRPRRYSAVVRAVVAVLSLNAFSCATSSVTRNVAPGPKALSLSIRWPSVASINGPATVIEAELANVGTTPITICQEDGGVFILGRTTEGIRLPVSPIVYGGVSDAPCY